LLYKTIYYKLLYSTLIVDGKTNVLLKKNNANIGIKIHKFNLSINEYVLIENYSIYV
jgi:hypothetical protein